MRGASLTSGKPSPRRRGHSPPWSTASQKTVGTALGWGSGICAHWSADVDDVPTAAGYYVAIAETDHAAVAVRGVEAGQALGENPAEFVDALAQRVLAQVDTAGDPLIMTAAGGMRLESYLSTRTFELVVHSLDIAAAVPRIEPPEFSDQLLSEVARVAATAAVLLGRGVELLRAMTGRGTLSPGFSMV